MPGFGTQCSKLQARSCALSSQRPLKGSTEKLPQSVKNGQPQGGKDTLFNLSMSYKTSRNYKATKVVFLKREEESSRCSLEEAVVTEQPGQEGLSET